jgi:hypothetical protein
VSNISIQTTGFTGAYAALNGSSLVDVTRLAFLRASLTLGFQRFGDVMSAGWRLWSHRLGLGFSGLAYLEDRTGNLCRVAEHSALDSSEKGAMSYWHGMVFAKLVAEHTLQIPWLAHVDDMIRKGVLTATPGTKERGDLAGRTLAGDWHVIEAKGRSSRIEKDLIQDAKHQAALITLVSGRTPRTHSACVTCLWTDPIKVILDDPPPKEGDDTESWSFTDAEFLNYYYRNMAAYIQSYGSQTGQDTLLGYVTAPLFPYFLEEREFFPFMPRDLFRRAPLRIGLPAEILESPTQAAVFLANRDSNPSPYIGLDGVALLGVQGWDTQNEEPRL